jgi:hypothetical protein
MAEIYQYQYLIEDKLAFPNFHHINALVDENLACLTDPKVAIYSMLKIKNKAKAL